MLPAFPTPDVATEIVPPSPIVNVGVETLTCPAFPVPEVVLRLLPGGPPLDLAAAEHAVALPTGI